MCPSKPEMFLHIELHGSPINEQSLNKESIFEFSGLFQCPPMHKNKCEDFCCHFRKALGAAQRAHIACPPDTSLGGPVPGCARAPRPCLVLAFAARLPPLLVCCMHDCSGLLLGRLRLSAGTGPTMGPLPERGTAPGPGVWPQLVCPTEAKDKKTEKCGGIQIGQLEAKRAVVGHLRRTSC